MIEHIFGLMLLLNVCGLLRTKDYLTQIVYLSSFSLIIGMCYAFMDSPDVAITESSIGAALSTSILLAFAKKIRPTQSKQSFNVYLFAFLCLLGMLIIFAGQDLPQYGGIDGPVHLHVNKYYLSHNREDIGISSFVAGLLASYRGYDTLGETAVIFTAGITALLITPDDQGLQVKSCTQSPITKTLTKVIVPYVILFGLYVQINGESSPGGGFQAGAILASCVIALSIATKNRMQINSGILLRLAASGVLIYMLTGAISFIKNFNYLNYNALPFSHAQSVGIFLVEIGVGITVFSVMTMLYYLFNNS